MDSAHWQWWGTSEHPRLHCHKSTWSGEEKYRISAKEDGIYVLHVHLMEKNAEGLKFYHKFMKNGKPRPKGINIVFSPLQLKPSMQ